MANFIFPIGNAPQNRINNVLFKKIYSAGFIYQIFFHYYNIKQRMPTTLPFTTA